LTTRGGVSRNYSIASQPDVDEFIDRLHISAADARTLIAIDS
jgi:hypothetical protein